MMFPEHVNEDLKKGKGLEAVRQELETDPPNSVYAIQFGEPDEEQESGDSVTKIFYAKQHPMIGYRYQIPSSTDTTVHPQFFMNDIVLLRLKENDAKEIREQQKKVAPNKSQRMISIDTLKKLQFYNRPNRRVVIQVKDLQGQLIGNFYKVKQLRQREWSYYFLFTLDEG